MCQSHGAQLEEAIGQPHLFCCTPTLVDGDFLDGALNLDDIKRGAGQADGIAEDGLHLGKLVLVTSDEMEVFWNHGEAGV